MVSLSTWYTGSSLGIWGLVVLRPANSVTVSAFHFSYSYVKRVLVWKGFWLWSCAAGNILSLHFADVLVTFCVSNLGGRRPPVEQGDSEGLAPTWFSRYHSKCFRMTFRATFGAILQADFEVDFQGDYPNDFTRWLSKWSYKVTFRVILQGDF